MNCWEFSVIRAIRSQSAQRLHEGQDVVFSVCLDDVRDSVVKKILTSWSLWLVVAIVAATQGVHKEESFF